MSAAPIHLTSPSPGDAVGVGVGRRPLVVGALAAICVTLTGCRIRLEDDAPPLPLIPTREPIPAEADLIWLLEDCRALAAGPGPHTDLYAEQAGVLRTALFRAGIPIETLDPVADELLLEHPAQSTSTAVPTESGSAEPDGTPSTTATSPAGSDPSTESALARIDALARCGAGLFPLIASLLAQRVAAVTLSGGALPADPMSLDPVSPWRRADLAAEFAEVTAAAVYGFEIVAAQTEDETRLDAAATLGGLRRIFQEQLARAGAATPVPPLGYPLPFPVDSSESAVTLAEHVLTGLIDGHGGLLPTVAGSAQQETARDVIDWLGSAAAVAAQWSLPLAAFPGMAAAP